MESSHHTKYKLPDLLLLTAILFLILIGLAMVYSSSHVWAEYKYGDSLFFVKRQLLFAGVGLICMYILYRIPYFVWGKYVNLLLGLCFLLLIIVLVPGIGIVRGGAQSWIGVGAFSIQPSEFMKLGLIMYISHYLVVHKKDMSTFKKGFLYPVLLVFITFGLIMLQPDLGTGVVLVGTCVLLIFIAGSRITYFVYLFLIGMVGFAFLIISAPYRISRITAFLNPWEDPLGDGFQIIQSLYAIGPGKLLGVGFGNSLQKFFYLPEPQTDFIFAIIGEELGFIGGSFVILLFFVFCWRGMLVALNAREAFGRYVAFGIVAMITIQVMINISVVTGLIPVTGITLPFLSYGGSSLTLTLCSVGILLNISRYSKE
jgi:cell division protein FtsW